MAGSSCPAGATHNPASHPNWPWCNRCQGLFYGGNVAGSRCPAGGTHTAPSQSGSADYHLPYGGPFV